MSKFSRPMSDEKRARGAPKKQIWRMIPRATRPQGGQRQCMYLKLGATGFLCLMLLGSFLGSGPYTDQTHRSLAKDFSQAELNAYMDKIKKVQSQRVLDRIKSDIRNKLQEKTQNGVPVWEGPGIDIVQKQLVIASNLLEAKPMSDAANKLSQMVGDEMEIYNMIDFLFSMQTLTGKCKVGSTARVIRNALEARTLLAKAGAEVTILEVKGHYVRVKDNTGRTFTLREDNLRFKDEEQRRYDRLVKLSTREIKISDINGDSPLVAYYQKTESSTRGSKTKAEALSAIHALYRGQKINAKSRKVRASTGVNYFKNWKTAIGIYVGVKNSHQNQSWNTIMTMYPIKRIYVVKKDGKFSHDDFTGIYQQTGEGTIKQIRFGVNSLNPPMHEIRVDEIREEGQPVIHRQSIQLRSKIIAYSDGKAVFGNQQFIQYDQWSPRSVRVTVF